MAESVDALVSNTSGAIHPGSIPGLGTESGSREICFPISFYPSLLFVGWLIDKVKYFVIRIGSICSVKFDFSILRHPLSACAFHLPVSVMPLSWFLFLVLRLFVNCTPKVLCLTFGVQFKNFNYNTATFYFCPSLLFMMLCRNH